MKVREYEEFVRGKAFMGLNDDAYNVVGLCGEAGEVAEWHKKMVFRANKANLTLEDLKNELGDVLHYVTRIALKNGWTLKECMEANVEKLIARNR